MSSIVRKQVLSFLKRSFTWNLGDRASFRSTGTSRLLQTPRPGLALPQEYLASVSCGSRTIHSVSQPTWATSKDESRELMAVWPDLVRDLTEPGRYTDIPDVKKWLIKVMQYNVPGGKKSRALACVYAYKCLAPRDDLTEDNLRRVRILAWCIEMLQAFLLVIDDIQDHAEVRRNQPCWYLHNNVGLLAINDALLMQTSIYQLIKLHFGEKDCYMNLVELFLDTTWKTVAGQCLDILSTTLGQRPNLDLFTMDRYNSIVKYKTAYYSFVLPVLSAMYFAGVNDPEMHRQAKTILSEMGHFFQVQDDYLDCYGNPEIMGKLGGDIKEGKCTWLIVVALQRATHAQRKILEECYGSPEKEKIERVKQLYNELGLPNTYSIYEEETYNLLHTHIQQISRGLPHDLFLKMLERTYRRQS